MCGVFSVYLPKSCQDAAKMTYFGLYALQHRGQESAGIASSNGENIMVYKDLGLVSQVFNEASLASLPGHLAVGHTRYSTTGSPKWQNAQPTLGNTAFGVIALAHNGNLINSAELNQILLDRYGDVQTGELANGNTTDTALITALLTGNLLKTALGKDQSLLSTALEILPLLKGAFSLVFMDEKQIYAVRDPQGLRPLVIGELAEGGHVVASENAALDIVGATFLREVEPGELIMIDDDGLHSSRFAEPKRSGCVFEYVYLARPDAQIFGRAVHEARVEMGRALAREFPCDADIVIPVPESGTPAAVGFAKESGIPFAQGLTKNSYVGRTFIQPTDALRRVGIRLKLNPLKSVITGKRLVVVDDSIVRGNTQKALVQMLKDSGAKEVHVRISSPPVKFPCYFGIDFAKPDELIANNLSVEAIREAFGADSLGFLSLENMTGATNRDASTLCLACFTGNYPVKFSTTNIPTKHLLERGTL
ncbi:MAG: amidophosphoribosyltransferase [Candidatus Ancillula trichonymphae]|jgi:amidophosphoribosyltransferase|nr:amidophosphoribosyltransferase [Candidatus Ancillula trichonymphae]